MADAVLRQPHRELRQRGARRDRRQRGQLRRRAVGAGGHQRGGDLTSRAALGGPADRLPVRRGRGKPGRVMTAGGQVRWGIISTANIARAVFLPGLRQAGGDVTAVAGREAGRAGQFARDNGIGRSVAGYQNLIDDPDIDALYIPLPNALHAEWTIRALEAGKPTLCEKPLCGVLPDTERVLGTARRTGTLLWEAFSFPFHAQLEELRRLVADGAIGELMEIK